MPFLQNPHVQEYAPVFQNRRALQNLFLLAFTQYETDWVLRRYFVLGGMFYYFEILENIATFVFVNHPKRYKG